MHTDEVASIFDDSSEGESDPESGSDLDADDFEYNEHSDSDEESGDHDNDMTQHNPTQTETDNHNVNVNVDAGGDRPDPGQAGHQWTTVVNMQQDKPPVLHEFSSPSGPVFTPETAQPIDYFDRFFESLDDNEGSKSLWQLLVDETNSYQELYISKNPILQPHSKVHQWRKVDIPQMKAFIGVWLNMGILRKHSIESYWNTTDYSQDTPMFRKIFKLATFKLLLRFLHVSDSAEEPPRGSDNYDEIYKFRSVLEHLCSTWAREYRLGPKISIDESIVGFKGRHQLVKYIRIKKHHQWGPKEYNLCDSTSGYCHQTIYHTKGMSVSEHGQPFAVCDKLMTNHTGKHHHLIVDNYYTSVALCEIMLSKDVYVTGTIQSNRRALPVAMKTKLKAKGEIIANRKGNMLCINWMDRKQVRLLSSYSTAAMVDVEKYDNSVKKVPQVVIDYNKGMGGVDMADQMTDSYAGEFRTVKCWKKIVFHLIDRTVTNAYICYKTNPNLAGKKLTHYQFIIKLVEGLIGNYQEPRKRVGRPSIAIPQARKTERHFLEVIPNKKRKKCSVCAQDRSQGFKGTRITTWCKDCGVGLCKGQCFINYHK